MPLPMGFAVGSSAIITFEENEIKIELDGLWTPVMCDAVHRKLLTVSHEDNMKRLAHKPVAKVAEEVEVVENKEVQDVLTDTAIEATN